MGLRDIFDDAHRRIGIAKQRNEFDRARLWTGMDFKSYMKDAVDKGIMVPVGKETPRAMGWYKFTEKGWAQYDHIFEHAPDWFDPEYKNFHISYESLNWKPDAAEDENVAAMAM